MPSVLCTTRGHRQRAVCKTWGTVFPNNYGPLAWWITYIKILSASVKLNIYRKHDTRFERHFGMTHAIFSLFKLNCMILYTLLNYKTSQKIDMNISWNLWKLESWLKNKNIHAYGLQEPLILPKISRGKHFMIVHDLSSRVPPMSLTCWSSWFVFPL